MTGDPIREDGRVASAARICWARAAADGVTGPTGDAPPCERDTPLPTAPPIAAPIRAASASSSTIILLGAHAHVAGPGCRPGAAKDEISALILGNRRRAPFQVHAGAGR